MNTENAVLNHLIEELDWPTPLPLQQEGAETLPYPLDGLPAIIRNAVTAYQSYGQQPVPLITCSALASLSLAAQSLANVARDATLVTPVSLYFLVVAASGERKSAADQTFIQPLRQWELRSKERLAPEVHVARTLHQAWRAEKDGLLNQIRRTTASGDDSDYLKAQFIELMNNEPEIPLTPALFFEDTTQEALALHLAHGWPSASLWSDEGGIVISSPSMQHNATKFVATLNRLWDGKTFATHRKTTASVSVSHRRLTISLMLQPLILQQMLCKQNGVSRQSGFMARCLMAYPTSAMGARYYQEPPQSDEALQQFHARLMDCLDESLSLDHLGCRNIPTLTFSPRAKTAWIDFFNHMERGLKNPNQWSTIGDFASKAAENAARLAALFHLFEGKSGHINHENLEKATHIIRWHLLETRRLLAMTEPSKDYQNATRLLALIKARSLQETTPRYLQQYSPVRNKQERNHAIQILIENYYLKESRVKGKSVLHVNPLLFGS